MKRSRSSSPDTHGATSSQNHDSSHKSKKLKLHASYTIESPYPNFIHPTPTEALEVHRLLAKEHPNHQAERRPAPSTTNNSANTCGDVPNVIEALIDTILSQNTSGRNSSSAKTSLDTAFGRNNFAAIANAPRGDVVDAIRQGGLANKKAATIQELLNSIHKRHGDYSLQHLAETGDGRRISDDAVMKELISYNGVGPKTASCVLLFCLGRDSFAVDTHVFRLSKVLGWVPDKADRVLAQAHLDLRVPGELKYGLHVLMLAHGRSCKGCKKSGSNSACTLKSYVNSKKRTNQEQGLID